MRPCRVSNPATLEDCDVVFSRHDVGVDSIPKTYRCWKCTMVVAVLLSLPYGPKYQLEHPVMVRIVIVTRQRGETLG